MRYTVLSEVLTGLTYKWQSEFFFRQIQEIKCLTIYEINTRKRALAERPKKQLII